MLNAVEYFKEKERMTKGCNVLCSDCPLSKSNNGVDESCGNLAKRFPEKAVEIVENWSKEHPVKTYLDDFLEKYPNAPTTSEGIPRTCLENLYDVSVNCVVTRCRDCWKRPLTED